MRKIICRAALMLALCLPVCALAATEPNAKTIEDTTTYEGDTIKITIDQWCYAFNRTNLRFFVANVYVSDPAQMQTAFAGEQYSKNNAEATSAIAERHGAILAINGDYYGAQERGYVLRNGVLYRASAQSGTDALVIGTDGNFRIITEGETSADTLVREGAWQVLTFGPALVKDGQVTVSSSDEGGRAMTSNPRTAIGQCADGSVLLLVLDGRSINTLGATMQDVADIMLEYGAVNAGNLDGGSSSVMVYDGEIINNCASVTGPRNIPTAFIVLPEGD